jgi:membrane associated rhomboid family serine protease
MKVPKWLCHNNLPRKELNFSDAKLQTNLEVNDYQKFKNWQPQQKQLIKVLGLSRKLPPIYSKELQNSIINNLKNKHKFMALGYLIPAAIFLTNFLFLGFDVSAFSWFLVFFLVSALYVTEYQYGLNTVKGIKERALFFNWLYSSYEPRRSLVFCIFFMFSFGLLQISISHFTGNEDQVFNFYGVMYKKLSQGEFWRLLTGPLLHYSLLNFLNNFLLIIMIGTLCLCLIGSNSIRVFLSGNVVGAYFQYLIGSQELDNCGGVSFGIYSLFGLLLGFNFFIEKILPKGFSISLVLILVIGIFSSELLLTNSASVGHITGLVIGIVSNFFIWLFLKTSIRK